MSLTAVFFLVAGLLAFDFSMPFVYAAWRFDKPLTSVQLKEFRSRYRLVAIPRTILLLGSGGAIAFAPPNAANNVSFLSLFVGMALAYGANCLFNLAKAFSKAKASG